MGKSGFNACQPVSTMCMTVCHGMRVVPAPDVFVLEARLISTCIRQSELDTGELGFGKTGLDMFR